MKEVIFVLILLFVHFTRQRTVKSQVTEGQKKDVKYGEENLEKEIKHRESLSESKLTVLPLFKPVVCYERDREDIRRRLIAWLRAQEESHSVEEYNVILKRYFDKLDKNNDTRLDAMEFLELTQTNATSEEAASDTEDEYISPILRGLCTDALIAATDSDSDWKLTFDEFSTCLNPDFKPPRKGCELEGKMYDDGAEFPMECNSCVCACGHWVCTVLKCEDGEVTDKNNGNVSSNSEFVVEGEKAEKQLIKEMEKGHSYTTVQPLTNHRHGNSDRQEV